MAWNKESKASRRARVAKQLRDKHGKWIEMGGGVKWFKNGAWHNGTASAFIGNKVEVTMEDGSKQLIGHREIEPIRAKGSLTAKPEKPTGSVQAKKSAGRRAKETVTIKDNDPGKRLTTNADDLEEGDEVHLVGRSSHSGKYGINDTDAAAFEDRGFELPLDDKGEPIRARVVDTSGESVILEDSNGKRHEVSKKDNVIADDPEVDAALQNREENDSVPDDVDDFDVKSVNAKDLGIPKEAISAYNKGVTASKSGDLDKSEKNFELKNGEEFSDDFTVGYLDGIHIADGARDKFQGLYHKYAQAKARGDKPVESKAEIPKEAPKAKVPEKSKGDDLPLDGLELTDAEKKSINEAETGEEALKRLTDSDAGDFLPTARANKDKAFVDAYRKAIKDITEKHDVTKDEAPAEEAKKSEGTPIEAIEKSMANLAEDIADIKSQKLEKEPEDAALAEAAYDVKNDAGDEFLLTAKRGEEEDEWQLDVTDSKGNVVDTLPLEDQKPQDFAKAIKNSIESKSTSKESEAPTEAPEVTPEVAKPLENTPKANVSLDDLEAQAKANGDTVLYHGGLPEGTTLDDIDLNRNGSQQNKRDRSFGGFYLTDKSSKSWSDKYAMERNGVMHGFAIDKNAQIDDRGKAQIDRLSAEDRAEAAKNFDVIMGKDLLGRTQYVILNKDVVKGVGETNLKDDKAPKDMLEAPKEEPKAEEAPRAETDKKSDDVPLNKALKDAGFSDDDIKKIEDAKNETEASKAFFQSTSGKKAANEDLARQDRAKKGTSTPDDAEESKKYDAANKAFRDFIDSNLNTGKAESDKKVQDNLDERAKADEIGSPEARAERAKSTLDRGKERDAERAATNTDEAKLAELDRKIAAGEKMADDAESKGNDPLAKRINENLDALKKQREKLAPKEEAPAAEESSVTAPGEPFDVPEGGVPILSNKKLERKRADQMKVGDKFFGFDNEKGDFTAVTGSQLRATPDGESYAIKDIKTEGPNTTWTAVDSQGNEKTLNWSVGNRKSTVIQDSEKNRESMGLTKKSDKPAAEEAPASENSASLTDDQIIDAFDKLEAAAGKVKAKSVDETIAKTPDQQLGDGNSLALGRDERGNLAYEIKDKDGKVLGTAPFSASDSKRAEAVRDALGSKKDEKPKEESAPEKPKEEKTSSEEPAVDPKVEETSDEKNPEEEKLAEDFVEEAPAVEAEVEPGYSLNDENIKSTISEALQDILDDDIDNGGDLSWEDIKERTWPVPDAEGYYIAAGHRSDDEIRFIGLYDGEDNELETYDMEGRSYDNHGLSKNGEDSSDGSSERGRDDSDGGSLDRGTGDDGGTDSGRDENGSGDRVDDPEEYDRQAQSLVRAVQKELADNGDNVQLDDEYSVEFETDETGRERYRLYDSNDRTLVKIARKNEDRLGEILRGYSDADRKLREAFATERDSDGRRVTPTVQMQKMAGIGTYFENDKGDRYTKINGYAWGMSKAGDNSDNKNMGVIEGHGRWGSGEFTLGHDADHHRPLREIEAMSDDELRQSITEFSERIHGIIEVDGKIGDKRDTGPGAAANRDNENMQRFRYEAYRLNDEASDYANTLWNRLRESGAHTDGVVDIGEFNPSMDREPHTTKIGTVTGDIWTKLRNEYVGLDHRTLKNNFELRNSEKPSRGAVAWGNKMDKWAGSGELANDYVMYRSILASPDAAIEFSAGNVVVDKGIMSLADNPDTAQTYLDARSKRVAGKIPIMVEVQGRKGEKMTAADFGSDELVVPRGSKLFIASSEMDENGVLRVVARLNPSEAELAKWTNGDSSKDSSTPDMTPDASETSTPPSGPDAPTVVPDIPLSEPVGDAPSTPASSGDFSAGQIVEHGKHGRGTIVRVEGNGEYARVNFDKYNDPKKTYGINLKKLSQTGETATPPSAPETDTKTSTPNGDTSVGAWNVGERVNHGKHGVGTIQRLEGNGEFARVSFDKDEDPKRTYGVKLSKLGKGETGTPSSIKDPDTKVGTEKPAEKVNSGRTATRNIETNADGKEFIKGKGDAELYVGAIVVHPKFGRGRVVKLEGNGKYTRVVFDNDPLGLPRGIVGAKLEDIANEQETDKSGFVPKNEKK